MTSQQPNILFIMSDDHAASAISAYGSRFNSTPNIDRLASEGLRLDHCYVTNSICTPSRAAILTGTHNHINRVTTLRTKIDNRLPHVAKHLKADGYQTAIVGKWHLGEGPAHEPTGFDYWSVLPGQGLYHEPTFIEAGRKVEEKGYVTDVIADKCLDWLGQRDPEKPFFLMCHHKAPHRSWDPKPIHRSLYQDRIPTPETFSDDYQNRAAGVANFGMRVRNDLTYFDLDLVELPESKGERQNRSRKIPHPVDVEDLTLRCAITGESFSFASQNELADFKYQRYLRKYLQTVHSVDENVGRLLDYLDENDLTENTIVIYTSDQGFYLGEHGWFDKRLIYEQSFQMPFLIRYPKEIAAGGVNTDMACNVDFAPTWLDYAGVTIPNYMQGRSLRNNLRGQTPSDWTDVAYHRYWMNNDASHNVLAHYGLRDHRYKIIYWYNDPLGQAGANPGNGEREWELFDLEEDPLELFNVYQDPRYREIVKMMTLKLDQEMARIGDLPEHPVLIDKAG